MRSSFTFVAFAIAMTLSACGSPFVKGWRTDKEDTRTPEEKCQGWKGHGWNVETQTCEATENLNLTNYTEEQCKLVNDAKWLDSQCLTYPKMNEDQCARAANPEWVWFGDAKRPAACSPAKMAACYRANPENVFTSDGRCSEKPNNPTPTPDNDAANFLSLCKNPGSMQVSRTIALLIEATKKADCDAAAKALSEVDTLDLHQESRSDAYSLIDLTPLKGLPNLTTLLLYGNTALADLSPLATIPKLKLVDASRTAVADVSSLAHHPTLSWLLLDGAPIATKANRTAANCPTGDGINAAVSLFCAP